jgi:DNA-binding MarR family transcriptional regulator
LKNFDFDSQDEVLYALEIAKQAVSLLPVLPPDFKPVHFRILHAIYRVRNNDGCARITDINRALGFLLPNTTRFINEMVDLNIIKKTTSPSDKRVVLVRTTAAGEKHMQYILSFRERLEKGFAAISESDRKTMIKTISEVHEAINKICANLENKKDYRRV